MARTKRTPGQPPRKPKGRGGAGNGFANPNHPKRIAARERHAEWMAHRRRGRSITAIAKQYGVSKSTVSEAITALIRELPQEDALAVRTIELDRLDAALAKLWPVIRAGGEGIHAAVASLVRLSKRRSELSGCDAPARLPEDKDGNTSAAASDAALAEFMGGIARLATRGGSDGTPGDGHPVPGAEATP